MPLNQHDSQSALAARIDGRWLLRVGWLIDGRGEAIKTDQCLTIENDRIDSVEPYHPELALKGKMIDLARATVLPVLMDAHVHLTLSGTLDENARRRQTQQTCEASDSAVLHHLQSQMNSGVLAVRDGGDPHARVLKVKRRLKTPVHVAATCWAWHAEGRYGKMLGRAPERGIPLALAVARASLQMDHIKVIQSGINSLDRFGHETPPQFTLDELAGLRRYAFQKRLPVMVHANGAAPVQIALAAGCNSIEHGYFMGLENLQRMADQQVFWVPTVIPMAALTQQGVVCESRRNVAQRTVSKQLEQIAAADQMGVPIVLGTDAGSLGVDHGVAVRRELALLVEAGLPLPRAVQCATLNAARLMGLQERGTLQPGRWADFIVVEGGPDLLIQGLKQITALCIQGGWASVPGAGFVPPEFCASSDA